MIELGSGGGGESKANGADLSSDNAIAKDYLSALPDDALVVILLNLNTRDVVGTSVLSRRWRRIWALLLGLIFDSNTNPHQIESTLQAHDAALQCLLVISQDATAESVAVWLPVAARRLSGCLYFQNLEQGRVAWEGYDDEEEEEKEATQRGAFELPYLERATSVTLNLGFIGLAMPPAGVFTRLHELCLSFVRLQASGFGNVVSWPRCPCMQRLTVCDARGLDNLTIHSNSLKKMELSNVHGLRQLTIVAPDLKDLKINFCFYHSRSQPVATITAPQLGTLMWSDSYDPGSVHLGKMEHLKLLKPFIFIVYGNDIVALNPSCLSLLWHFKVIEHLVLTLFYHQNMDNNQYTMKDMTMLRDITILHLIFIANGHCFGASAFHVLRVCSGIRRLMLTLDKVEEETTCPPGCICIQQQIWETEHLLLNRLKEVEMNQFSGSEHEFTFVKRLFVWATALEKMTLTFGNSVTESVAKELGQVLQSFSRPEIHMKICTCHATINRSR